MKLLRLAIGSSFLLTSICSPVQAMNNDSNVDYFRDAWGAQMFMATGGNISLGINHYTPTYSAGIFFGGQITNGGLDNSNGTVGLFAGPRYLIWPRTYFAYGLDLSGTFGNKNGQDINSSYFVGPYASIEYYLSTHFLISAILNPFSYQHEELEGSSSVNTFRFFSSGGIGLSYLF